MPINTIRNNTGQVLVLWDVGTQIAALMNGQAVHFAPVTITSITIGGVGYHNRTGAFQNGESYLATFAAGVAGGGGVLGVPAQVHFAGNYSNVSFA
ncbi:MAG: hypothetical protein JSU63_06645 [Phycisphaerales bacterium]|nr:MAG: hypothetical protein JSU63_06645 [Phycisphaerales bacterium]